MSIRSFPPAFFLLVAAILTGCSLAEVLVAAGRTPSSLSDDLQKAATAAAGRTPSIPSDLNKATPAPSPSPST